MKTRYISGKFAFHTYFAHFIPTTINFRPCVIISYLMLLFHTLSYYFILCNFFRTLNYYLIPFYGFFILLGFDFIRKLVDFILFDGIFIQQNLQFHTH